MDEQTSTMFKALYEGDLKRLIEAIDNGADVNACESGPSGYTPLTLALELGGASEDTERIIRVVYDGGACVHTANAWGATPLISAMSVKQVPWAMTFLASGAEVNVRGIVEERLTSPLHEAAYWGLYDMLEWLIQAGADVEMYAHKHMRPHAYARTNIIHGPIELTRVARILDGYKHPIMSLWRHPVDMKHVKINSINYMEHNSTNWTLRLNECMKNKDWFNALLAIEMGALTSKDIAERVRNKRYTD